jgi:hypothetical protein
VGAPEEVVLRNLPIQIGEFQKTAVETNPTLKSMKKMIEAK